MLNLDEDDEMIMIRILNETKLGTPKLLAGGSLLVLALCATALLTLRNLALPFPFIFSDEFSYSRHALYGLPVAGSVVGKIPSFLYFTAFGWISSCGDGFLQCARLMNVFFFTASLLPIYRTARFFVDRQLAVVIAAFAIAAPIHTYTAYFIPEAMYFFLFWIFVWFILGYLHRNPLQLGSGIGVITALLTLVKPHGLILLEATTVFVLILVITRRQLYSFQWAFKVFVAMVLLFLSTRFGIGYILAGQEGLDLFGFYRGYVSALVNPATLPSLLSNIFYVAWGHLAGVILLFSIPVAICLSQLPQLTKPELENSSRTDIAELSLFIIVLIGTLLIISSKFTVDVAGGQYETLTRLHARYYNFAFPLFLIVTAAFIKDSKVAFISWFKFQVIIAVVLALGIVGAILSLHSFTPDFAEYPELAWMSTYPLLFLLIGVLAILLVACWTVKNRLGAQGFLFLFFPLVGVVSGFFVNKILLGYNGSAYDFGPLVTKHLINPEDRGRGAVVGEELGSLYRALFHLDSQTNQIVQIPTEVSIEPGMIASDRRWVLIFGYHELKIPYSTIIKTSDFSVIGLAPGTLVASSQPGSGSPINLTFTVLELGHEIQFSAVGASNPYLINGWSSPEAWGTWSDGNVAIIGLQLSRIPTHDLLLTIKGHSLVTPVHPKQEIEVFANNVNLGTLEFSENHNDGSRTLEIPLQLVQTTEGHILIKFNFNNPVSPSDLSLSDDKRKLGLGLVALKLTEKDSIH